MAERKRKIVEPSIDCIESLRDENKFLTNSPKKSSSTITCGVLSKSPLKGTKNGKMFSMRLCDSNPSISARAVCFDESKYNLFEPTKTYDVGKFKIKKGYGNTNEIELVIDDSSEIRESEHQFRIERSSFNIAQVIRGEAKNVRFITVKGKVLDISDIETVGKFPDLKQKREVVVGDSSGHIILVLWRDRANDIEFSVGDVLNIENCVLSTFNKVANLTTSFETSITKVMEEMEVQESSSLKPKNKVVEHLVAEISAFKDFKSLVKCFNCNIETEMSKFTSIKATTSGSIVKCGSCDTIFLGKWSSIINVCKVLIDGTWYSAQKGVLDILFGNMETMESPSEEQILKLLSTKYSVRIDTNLRKIEHAAPIDDLQEYGESEDTQV